MSYSIGPARGATKAAVLATLAMMYDERVLAHQPVHAHDKAAALKVAETQLNLVADLLADLEAKVSALIQEQTRAHIRENITKPLAESLAQLAARQDKFGMLGEHGGTSTKFYEALQQHRFPSSSEHTSRAALRAVTISALQTMEGKRDPHNLKPLRQKLLGPKRSRWQ